MDTSSETYAIFFGLAGAASSLILSTVGAAYGTARSSRGIALAGSKSEEIDNSTSTKTEFNFSSDNKKVGMKAMIPIVIAGVLAIYGLIFSVIVSSSVTQNGYSTSQGYADCAGGLTLGFCCLFAGIAVGVIGESGIVATARNSKMFVFMVLNLIYAEALGLYGLIIALILNSAF